MIEKTAWDVRKYPEKLRCIIFYVILQLYFKIA